VFLCETRWGSVPEIVNARYPTTCMSENTRSLAENCPLYPHAPSELSGCTNVIAVGTNIHGHTKNASRDTGLPQNSQDDGRYCVF